MNSGNHVLAAAIIMAVAVVAAAFIMKSSMDSATAELATLLEENPKARMFLETPRIDDAVKKDAVQQVLGDVLPKHIVNFVLVTIDKRRQRLLRSIAQQYHALLDEHMGREHVQVTVARPVDDAFCRRFSRWRRSSWTAA